MRSNKVEQLKKPEVNAPELLSVIDSLKYESYETFSYNGSNYLIIPLDQNDIESNDDEAWFAASTAISGWDIYILTSLPAEERRRKMFHEVLECYLIEHGLSRKDAHDMSRIEEEKLFGQRK